MQRDTEPETAGTHRLLELGVAALVGTALLAGCLVFVVLVAGAVTLAASGQAPGGWLFPVLLVVSAVGYWGLVYYVEGTGHADWNEDPLAEWEDWDADWEDADDGAAGEGDPTDSGGIDGD